MTDFTKITVLENDKITKAIFGKELPEYHKRNPFAYTPSSGYYDDNLVTCNVGFVFNTPSGRESKCYPYRIVMVKENVKSGSTNWVSDNRTPKRVLDLIKGMLDSRTLDNHFRGTPLKAKYDLGIKYLVVSTGSGGIESYKLSLDDL